MRRVLLVFALGAVGVVPRLRAQDSVTVGVGGELSAPVGGEMEVPIYADLRKAVGKRLGSYTVRVSWNPAVLDYRGWGVGAFGQGVARDDSTSFGVLWASGISVAGMDGVAGLLSVQLNPLVASVDTVRLQVTELSAAGTFTDLLASATVVTRPAAFCPALGRWGDLDQDGFANSRDALAILSNLVGLPVGGPFSLPLGDVDGDGKVNSRDALILLSYAVGLEIPGQRVLLIAGGACTTGSVPQVVILPDTADLVVGQSVNIIGFARDASGRLVAINGGQLSSADPRIATTSDRMITGREPGTTTVTGALGPGVQVSIPVIVRARRGTWHVNAPLGKLAAVQLGTQRWPFATPEYVFPLVSEGDTIRVAPGNVDYETEGFDGCEGYCDYAVQLRAGVIVIGDTLPDGTRPVLRARAPGYGTAFPWAGGAHGEVRNLVLLGFNYGVELFGLRALTMSNVRVESSPLAWGSGVYVRNPYYGSGSGYVDTLVIRNSVFLGDTLAGAGQGVYVANGAHYVEVRDTRFEYWDDGLELYGVDSLDVLRSEFIRNYNGIYAENCYRDPLGARISRSWFTDNTYRGIYLDNVRRAGLDHNRILARTGDAVEVYGSQCYGDAPPMEGAAGVRRSAQAVSGDATLTMLGDSIRFRAEYRDWLNTYDLDSVLVDSLWLESAADTALGQYSYVDANYARFTNSKLLNLYAQGINFTGQHLVVDHTDFTGCNVCDWNSATAVQAQGDFGSGPRVQLTNSSFFNLQYGLSVDDYGNQEGPIVVTANTFDSVATGLYLSGDSLVVADNLFTNVKDYALYAFPAQGPRPFVEAQVLRNQVTCAVAGYTSHGLRHDHGPVRFQDNSVQNCRWGLYAYNYSYPLASAVFRGNTVMPDSATYYRVGIRPDGKWRPTITGNRIVGGYYGIDLTITDTASAVIDSNAVSATGGAGIDIYYVSGPVTGVRNNIAANLFDGILNVGTSGPRSFTLGKFNSGGVGNGLTDGWAVNSATPFDATQNWWGSANGAGGPYASGLQDADSVSSTGVDVSDSLTSEPGDVPALAPRPVLAASAAAVRPDATRVARRPPPPAPVVERRSPPPDDRRPRPEARRGATDAERSARRRPH